MAVIQAFFGILPWLYAILFIALIWAIISGISSQGGQSANRVAQAADNLTGFFGPKAAANRKKERAEGLEIGREAEMQEKLIDDERVAVAEIDKIIKGAERLIGDEIARLQWVDSVLERLPRVRDAVQANRYKEAIRKQLAILSKEIVDEYKLEKTIEELENRLAGFGHQELNLLRREEHAERQLDAVLNREIVAANKGKDFTLSKLKSQQKNAYDGFVNSLKNIIQEKEELMNKMRRGMQERVVGPASQFNALIQEMIRQIASDHIIEAAQTIQKAIAIKTQQLSFEQQIRNYETAIVNLGENQRRIEHEIKTFIQNAELSQPRRTREGTASGDKRGARAAAAAAATTQQQTRTAVRRARRNR